MILLLRLLFGSSLGSKEESLSMGGKDSHKSRRPEFSARINNSMISTLRLSRWRVRRSVFLSVLYLLFVLPKAYSLDPSRRISQYGHTLWRTQDGVVNATSLITQTTDGYIWTPTTSGLARFDGVNFVPWTPLRDIPFLLRQFTALLGGSDGSLWIGTSHGLGRLKDGQFRSYSKPGDRWGIFSIIEDHAGHIWVTRYHLPPGEGAICEALHDGLHCYGQADGVPLPYGLGLAEDSQGNFWIGSQHLCRWRPGSACAMYFNNRALDDTGMVASGPSQTVWVGQKIGSPEGGLQRFSTGKWSSYTLPGFDGSSVGAEAILFDRDGSLWVGTEKVGLYRIHNGVVDHYGPADGLSGHQVADLHEDHEGNLWVTTDGGVDVFRDTPVITYSVREGLSSPYTSAILASRDGSIWIAGDNGIDVLRDGRKRYPPGWPSRMKQTTVSLFEDHTSTIWMSLANDLAYWDQGNFHILKQANGGSVGDVTGITEDAQHSLWALSRNSLFRIDHRQVQQRIPLPKDFAFPGLLAPDLQGGVRISDKANHVFGYRNGQFQTMELKDIGSANGIEAMIADAEDPLLVATLGGLFRWDGHRWTILDARNGLPCTQLLWIVKDTHGSLWVGAQCGLLRIDVSELTKWRHDAEAKVATRVLDRFDGAYPATKVTVEPLATRAADGRIWYANGFEAQTFDPDHLFQNLVVPPVHIDAVIADEKVYEPSSALNLPARTRNLEIDYTALSLSVPQKVQFRYKLEGRDSSWQNPGKRRQAFYTDLKPGNYTFHVIASNNDGLWNETGSALSFAVEPAFDQTTWFRALCILAAAGVAWALYWLRLKQTTTRLHQRLGVRMEERERIARELHDTFFQGIQVLMLRFHTATSQLRKDEPARRIFEETLKQSDQVMLEGRELVLDLRETVSGATDLPTAFADFGERMRKSGSCEFKVVVNGSVRPLHPVVFEELSKIGKEALSNAFRHSGAHSIEAELNYEGSQLRIRVRDDGAGIDSAILRQGYRDGHFGLPGMRERARKVGAHLDVWSRTGAGTEVELRIGAGIACVSDPNGSWLRKLRRLWPVRKREDEPDDKGNAST
jgi:signal transduction histidine kinase/ligand-binding sensor domain-containing protein